MTKRKYSTLKTIKVYMLHDINLMFHNLLSMIY